MQDDKEAVFLIADKEEVHVTGVAYYRCPAELRDFILKVVETSGPIISFHMDTEKYWNIGFGVGYAGDIRPVTIEENTTQLS